MSVAWIKASHNKISDPICPSARTNCKVYNLPHFLCILMRFCDERITSRFQVVTIKRVGIGQETPCTFIQRFYKRRKIVPFQFHKSPWIPNKIGIQGPLCYFRLCLPICHDPPVPISKVGTPVGVPNKYFKLLSPTPHSLCRNYFNASGAHLCSFLLYRAK